MSSRPKSRSAMGTPAPKAYKLLGEDRVVIEALCPDAAMAHFSFGSFRRAEADEVRVVHCPICRRKHALMWPATWVSTAAALAVRG